MIIAKHNVKIMIGNEEIKGIVDFDISYAPFTEYGYRPATGHIGRMVFKEDMPWGATIIDSDAIVIDENVLALPAPGQKDVVEDDLQST